MTASRIFLYFCLAFVGGIFLNSVVFVPQLLMLVILTAGIFLTAVFWHNKKLVIIGFCILFLAAGIWRYQAVAVRKYVVPEGKISLVGIVAAEPDVREKSVKLKIKNSKLKILVTTRKYPEYKYGDKLEITGLLKAPPEDINGWNYKDYLKKDGIYYVIDFPKIELAGQGFGNPVMEILLSFKNKFKETAETFIPPPQVGILEALAFGQESQISKEWKDKLNLTGTRHIAAVSGMNITIISSLILNFLLLLGFWRKQAFYISLGLIILYILMIGAPASAVRAGVMAGLFIMAKNFGRISLASRAIVLAASLMLFFNPMLLRLDAGFQLSFLAMMGLVYLQPAFSYWLKKVPDYKFFPARTTLSATLSAQIFTAPILIYNFGYVSLVSVLANVLIVPFLAPITILIFGFGIFGMIFGFLGWILSFPTFLALSYITKIIDLFSKLSLVSLKLENLHWIWLLVSYLILSFWIRRLNKNAPTQAWRI